MASEREIFAAVEAAEIPLNAPVPVPRAQRGGGRRYRVDPIRLVAWRQANNATIRATAERFGVSAATVTRYVRDYSHAAELEGRRYQSERLDTELAWAESSYTAMYLGFRNRATFWPTFDWERRCREAEGTEGYPAILAARDAAVAAAADEFDAFWLRHMGSLPSTSQLPKQTE